MPTIDVAFLGTGLMGAPMAENIARADIPVTAWNRTRSKAETLREHAVVVADDPAEAVRGADIVCCKVADADAVAGLLFSQGVAAAMAPGAVFVDMSPISPKVEREHAERLRALGKRHLDAPVSGGLRGAREASLAIMVGGDKDAFVDAMPVLACMGRPIRVGPDGTGQLAKLCNQAILAVTIGGLSEAMLLAAAGGADPAQVRDALRGGFAESRILHEQGGRMLERNWVPGSRAGDMLADLGAVIEAAAEAGLDLPFVSLARDLYQGLVARGAEGHDHAALLLELEHQNPAHRVGDKPDTAPGS